MPPTILPPTHPEPYTLRSLASDALAVVLAAIVFLPRLEPLAVSQ